MEVHGTGGGMWRFMAEVGACGDGVVDVEEDDKRTILSKLHKDF